MELFAIVHDREQGGDLAVVLFELLTNRCSNSGTILYKHGRAPEASSPVQNILRTCDALQNVVGA